MFASMYAVYWFCFIVCGYSMFYSEFSIEVIIFCLYFFNFFSWVLYMYVNWCQRKIFFLSMIDCYVSVFFVCLWPTWLCLCMFALLICAYILVCVWMFALFISVFVSVYCVCLSMMFIYLKLKLRIARKKKLFLYCLFPQPALCIM